MPRATVPAPTARLSFHTWRTDDLPLAKALWGDPRVTALIGGPFGEDQVRARLELEIAHERDYGVQYWPIFLREGDTHVGCCGLKPYDPERHEYELGVHLRVEHWGRGLAVEAGRAVIAHAFGRLGALRLVAGHHHENRASQRTIEKLGFRYLRHELFPPTGLEHPLYALDAGDSPT